MFHPHCAGLNSTNLKAWTANVGLLWFCDVCRVNFNPVVMDREAIIVNTLRALAIRMDSLDLRVGQYGETLKSMNQLLSVSQHLTQPHLVNSSMLLDDATTTNNISSIANHIMQSSPTAISTAMPMYTGKTATTATMATAATTTAVTTAAAVGAAAGTTSTTAAAAAAGTTSITAAADATAPIRNLRSRNSNSNNAREQPDHRLRIANRNQQVRGSSEESLKSFYVTPFHIEQTENDILEYLKETINVGNSTIKCTKLVPRGKDLHELSFVSFKLMVSENLACTVADTFYWPDGVEVREFQPKNGSRPVNIRPPEQ